MHSISGVIADAELCRPVNGAEIITYDSGDNLSNTTYSNESGEWEIPCSDNDIKLLIKKTGFIDKKYNIDVNKEFSYPIRLLNDKLIGYQEKLWFLPGESISVYVHSSKDFSAKLYRHGLYKELILDLGHFGPCIQSVKDGYLVENGLDWEKTLTYQIPVNSIPGLYSLLLESKFESPFAIPFIVSTPQCDGIKTSKYLVLASTNTWQSYNIWGGRSRYRNFEEDHLKEFRITPNTKITRVKRGIWRIIPQFIKLKIKRPKHNKSLEGGWRFKKLTIKRPYTNCSLEDDIVFKPFTNHLAAGEWRLLAWLEREKIPYDIISGCEFHKNTRVLEGYKAVILTTHSEYWTKEMFMQLKYYHEEKGLWILNISGNSIYREIEFFEDGSTRCISLSFKDSCYDETQLLGVRFNDYDYATCAPYKILVPDHWIYKHIPTDKVSSFGGLALNQNTIPDNYRYDPGRPGSGVVGLEYGLDGMGASGWETDKLSKTAPKSIKIVAKGINKNGGADMVIREPMGSRGGMFSVSSLVFGSSLLIDNVSSQIVHNIINRIETT